VTVVISTGQLFGGGPVKISPPSFPSHISPTNAFSCGGGGNGGSVGNVVVLLVSVISNRPFLPYQLFYGQVASELKRRKKNAARKNTESDQ
jgi:hypothetical protein